MCLKQDRIIGVLLGCNENNKIKEGQSISSEEAGMSINANGKNETFKPSDYTLEAKKEYVYEVNAQ